MTSVDLPKIEDRKLKYLGEDDKVKKFIASLRIPQDKLLVRLIYVAGMRIPEVCKLRAECINFKEKTITVFDKVGKLHMVSCGHCQ